MDLDELLANLRKVEGQTTHYLRNPEGPEAALLIERLIKMTKGPYDPFTGIRRQFNEKV
jgi:hypothetical protein